MKFAALLVLAALAAGLVWPAAAQYDDLTPYILPDNPDPRRMTSVGNRYIDTTTDPLGASSITTTPDPYHTREWIAQYQRLTGEPVTGVMSRPDSEAGTTSVAGRWRLQTTGAEIRTIDIDLRQSGDVVYGRGSTPAQAGVQTVSASGFVRGNVLYLDIMNIDEFSLYKGTLTVVINTLTGGYSLFGPTGAMASGGMTGSRLA